MKQWRISRFFIFWTFIFINLFSHPLFATEYYVDFESGDDANSGTRLSLFSIDYWKTIPGTRKADDKKFLNTSWGSVDKSNPIKAGDVITIKSNTTYNSSNGGGRILIDSNFYQSGTESAPIVIRTASTLGDSSKNVNIDGSNMTIPSEEGLITISNLNYIVLTKGNSARNLISLSNANGAYGLQILGNPNQRSIGVEIRYLESKNNTKAGINISYSNNWMISNSLSHDNGGDGFSIGRGLSEQTSNGLIQYSDAYNNGRIAASISNYSGHGFNLSGANNFICFNCNSYSNSLDGFYLSQNESPPYGVGISNSFYFVNSIAYQNRQSGWHVTSRTNSHIYHSIAHANGSSNVNNGNLLLSGDASSEANKTNVFIKNSIAYKPEGKANLVFQTSSNSINLQSSNNIYFPKNSNSEILYLNLANPSNPISTPYNPLVLPIWSASNDKIGHEFSPEFIIKYETFTALNYKLAENSAALCAGIPLSEPSSYVNNDRVNVNRNSSPLIGGVPVPEIGIYQFSATYQMVLPALNLKVVENY